MIRYLTINDGQLTEHPEITPSCWINIAPPFDKVELQSLADRLNVPLDFMTDSLDVDERSRYEREDDVRLIVINTPIFNESDKENDSIYVTIPIGIILVEDYILTISPQHNPVLNLFLEGKVKGFNPANRTKFVLQIFERTVHEYLSSLKRLNMKRNLIEEELYNSSRNSELKQLLRIEKSLVYFVSSLSSNDLLKLKMKRIDLLQIRQDEDLMDLFEDIIIDNTQALEMANVHTNILSGTMEAYASIVSNNLNTFIQRLTLVTIILMVPTLVASFYGMNVPLPMMDSPYAFYLIIGLSISISVIITWFFVRKRMF